MSSDDRLSEFEARLAALKHKMESGLIDRARSLRELAQRVEGGDALARKAIKTESHKLRGVAGSYGHQDLTEKASQLEQRASVSPPATVGQMARELADLAEQKGRQSKPPPAAMPPEATPSTPPTRKSRPAPRPTGPRLRVLAMDDDPITRRLLLLTLEQVGGFEAHIVSSAAEALDLLSKQTFDLIVSDAMMPDMNGRQFSSAARAGGATMPIVILSAASPDELGWSSESSSGDRWLRKPFKPTELVRDLLRIAGKTKR
jgi:CheY-like chemotaxis protein/HPt (histidine-containing phosphotransfer) domain-containing protein